MWTLRQCQKVVRPYAVSVRTQILPIWSVHDAYVRSLAMYKSKESVGLGFYRSDYLLPRPFPSCRAQMRNPLIGILARLLVDACDLSVGH